MITTAANPRHVPTVAGVATFHPRSVRWGTAISLVTVSHYGSLATRLAPHRSFQTETPPRADSPLLQIPTPTHSPGRPPTQPPRGSHCPPQRTDVAGKSEPIFQAAMMQQTANEIIASAGVNKNGGGISTQLYCTSINHLQRISRGTSLTEYNFYLFSD